MTIPPRFERPLKVRFAHCDPAGIVFFPQYLVMLNGLVEDWISDALGIAYTDLLGPRRVGLPTVSLTCQFSAISKMGDDIVLGLSLEHIGRSSIRLDLDVMKGATRCVAVQQVLVTTSLDTHQAIAIPDDLRDALVKFQSLSL